MTPPSDKSGRSSEDYNETIAVDRQLYSDDVVFKVCHLFTGRCELSVEREADGQLRVVFATRNDAKSLAPMLRDFRNELINQRVRESVAEETSAIRELIVRQAFAEADFRFKTDSL